MEQTLDDLLRHLNEQVRFLKNSANAFDRGFEGEAKRMAVVIRVLVYESSNSRSLLGQLNLLKIPFYDTVGQCNLDNVLTFHGLVQIELRPDGAAYRAPLDDRPPHKLKWVSFLDWWKKIVFVDDSANSMSRQQLILAIANKDGGAHVDPKLDSVYAALSRANSMKWLFDDGMGPRPLQSKIELVSVRQITHEVLRTLERHGING